jgi:hypothetical protein
MFRRFMIDKFRKRIQFVSVRIIYQTFLVAAGREHPPAAPHLEADEEDTSKN